MPREPRMYLPGIPCHVIQRGNNREATFFAEHDYQFYLECLQDAAQRYQVKVHAYVLMTNHVHILMTPAESESISLTCNLLGGDMFSTSIWHTNAQVHCGRADTKPVLSMQNIIC